MESLNKSLEKISASVLRKFLLTKVCAVAGFTLFSNICCCCCCFYMRYCDIATVIIQNEYHKSYKKFNVKSNTLPICFKLRNVINLQMPDQHKNLVEEINEAMSRVRFK